MYDVIVLGAGPGGYVAAERAGEMGMKVLLIDRNEVGGVCLNEGCIPTKTLLNSAKIYAHAMDSESFGVHTENASFDMKEAQNWKSKVIETNRKGILFLMKKYGVDVIKGSGVFNGDRSITVNGETWSAENIIIAAGSSPFVIPVPGADSSAVVNSSQLLELDFIPESLAVIGGGVIGMEFASMFSMLGVKVDVVEMLDEVVPFMEKDLAKNLRRALKGVKFHLGAKVESIENNKIKFTRKDKTEALEAEIILMAAGRKPNLEGYGLEKLGLEMSPGGIEVDSRMRTSVPGVYAVGDVNGISQFAHSASRMAEIAVNSIAGRDDSMDYSLVPWAVYTNPEAAGCGLTEAQAAEKGFEVLTSTLQMRISARYFAENGMTPGLCKVVADRNSGLLLGIHMLGNPSSELVHSASLILKNRLTVEDIKTTVFPHPSVSEVIREAVLALE